MSIATNRKILKFAYTNNQQYFLLECLKTERKSLVKYHKEDGTTSWLKDKVVAQFKDKTPKTLHVLIPAEGIYEIIGQPYITGLYCLYKGSKGTFNYEPISEQEKQILITLHNNGIAYRDALISLGKTKLF